MDREVNILISSVGRRGQLIQCFRQSLGALGLSGAVCAVDCSSLAPAGHLADRFSMVPRCDTNDFIPELLRLCQEWRVALLVPTIDTELAVLAENQEEFARQGTRVVISKPEAVRIASDKVVTHTWLQQHGFPVLRQSHPEKVFASPGAWPFPLAVKPRHGSASMGFQRVASLEELRFLAGSRADLIVQEWATGSEHTINVFVSAAGACLCAVPHRRIEVRAGEVSKGVTVKHRYMMDLARRISEALPGIYGPLNIQCFLTEGDEVFISEINARFGGGYPLAFRAGADFPRWMIEEWMGIPAAAAFDDWEDGLAMLRYDEAVFQTKSQRQASSHEEAVHRV